MIYKSTGGVSTLESAAFSDGRIVRSTAGYVTNYNITDHLGSVRVVFDGSGTVLETNDYYAFGGRIEVSSSLASDNRFKFNGKELQTTGDLGYLDYGARMYDDVIGRWFGMDPAEQFSSPYNFCGIILCCLLILMECGLRFQIGIKMILEQLFGQTRKNQLMILEVRLIKTLAVVYLYGIII